MTDGAGHRGTEDRKIDKLLGIGADGCPNVEHDALAAQRRPDRGNRRSFDIGHGAQAEFRHRHQRTGIAGRHAGVRPAALHRLDRLPHRGFPAAVPERLARLVVHLHRDVAMGELALVTEARQPVKQRLDFGIAAVDHEPDVGTALQHLHKAGEYHARSVVAAHCVYRDGYHAEAVFRLFQWSPPQARAKIAVLRARTTAIRPRRHDFWGPALNLASFSARGPRTSSSCDGSLSATAPALRG